MGDSTTGQIVGGIVGGIIGFFAGGNVVQGFALGYALGGVVDPPKFRTEGPRLQDKRVTGVEYGAPIPRVYGCGKVGGWLMWATDLYERTVEQSQGKGGGEQTTTTYVPFFRGAFLLCKGPIVGVRKIYADGKVVYDGSVGNVSVPGGKAIWFTGLVTQLLTLNGSMAGAKFTIYLGTEDQMPDPLMEQFLGAGNVPAYRGYAYVVIDEFNLMSFGKRIPLLEFEVVGQGSVIDQALDTIVLDPPAAFPVAVYGHMNAHYNPLNGDAIFISRSSSSGWQIQSVQPSTGVTRYSVFAGDWSGSVLSTHPAILDEAAGLLWARTAAVLETWSAATGQFISRTFSSTYHYSTKGLALNIARDEVWTIELQDIVVLDRTALIAGASFTAATRYRFARSWTGPESSDLFEIRHRKWMLEQDFNSTPNFRIWDADGVPVSAVFSVGSSSAAPVVVDPANDCVWIGVSTGATLRKFDLATLSETLSISVGISTGAVTVDPVAGLVIYYNNSDTSIKFADGAGTVKKSLALGTTMSYGIPVALVWCPGDAVLAVRHPSPSHRVIRWRLDRLQSEFIQIDDIVNDICVEAGVPSGKIDVTSLSETISGYVVDGRMQARDMIEPLRKVSFFDLLHSNAKLRALVRGGAAARTISYEEMVAEPGTNPLAVSVREDQDVASTLEVSYNDPAINLEINTQRHVRPGAITGDVVSERLPLAISASQARRTAQILLYAGQSQRHSLTLPLTRRHLDLEPGDPFNFAWPDGSVSRMVAAKVGYTFPVRVDVEAFEEDASVYSDAAVGINAGWVPPSPQFAGALALSLLDIPILADTHDYEGAYVAISGGGVQSGIAAIFESMDNGITYRNSGSFPLIPSGYANTALGNYTGLAWDETNTVRVTIGSGILESYTDIQVLNGRGAALLGNEIIQWRTATLVSAGTYDLTGLLRGRRGTEWATAAHASGERFVPLTDGLPRIAQTALGQTRLYKAALPGTNTDDAPPVSFTNRQVGKKPFSPVYIAGTRDGSGNLTGTFMRRSRIGSGWGANVEIPLGEDQEKYEIDIMQGATVKRTILATTQSFSYSAAEQTADFGSTQASVLVNVYQMSLIAGRGYPGVATI